MSGRLAIIPARGGSKRLPRKNVLPFLGRPMIVHTIEQARESGCFERVVVSTEDEEIGAIARQAGAELHARPERLAGDTATVVEVCLEVLRCEEERGRSYEVFACLYATAPLRSAGDIAAVVALVDDTHPFALAATTYALAPHQALRVTTDGTLLPMWTDLVNLRASELGPLVVDNGSTYAARVGEFRTARSFYGPGLRGHVMPRQRSVDIDEPADYELACWYASRAGREP
ncbi:MAG: acylneuraminate cytidylyltransferase family protein [Deltaproteobacteria bacterium]|nr:acylneuraminate cytidylyltransferase family protein [Deltaproteobacteria bacterium]